MVEFSELELRNWRQFAEISLDLGKQVTILTGQNGCGKTTLLNILSRHFGWSLSFVSTPFISRRMAKRLWSDVFFFPEMDKIEGGAGNPRIVVGSIKYSNGHVCQLATDAIVQAQYQLQYENMQNVEGMHIPSHRPVATYNNVPSIPTDPTSVAQNYQNFQQLMVQVSNGNRVDNPGKIQKQSIISLAVFGEGNASVSPNPDMRRIFCDFQDVLRRVMPKSLGFLRLEIRMPEVVCVTESGDFSLDAMSGGVNAIFSIAWQIHMFGHNKDSFFITIDEPENHLHPSMQRTLLPNLAEAFPKCRIIAATHSPFVVSSFPDANIYALARNSAGRIESLPLNLTDISGTPNEVLRDILDVDSNLPVWVEERIFKVIEGAAQIPIDERARYIMAELEELGIADAIVEYKREGRNAANN